MYSRIRVAIRSAAVVLLGMILAEMYNRETPCEMDRDIVLDNTRQSTCRFFSETYEEARSKFRQACHQNGAGVGAAAAADHELHTFHVIENYTMDICVVWNGNSLQSSSSPSSGEGGGGGVVVHTSGFHGVEGYAGSAIQVAWLQSHFAKQANNNSNNSRRPSVILVHAVNPYGMAHYRRPNENNVDLNRNGLLDPNDWKKVLERDPNIANYQDFDERLFNPQRAPTNVDQYIRIWIQAAWAIYCHGILPLKRAMVTGQYHNDKGIFYGGQKLEPSLEILWNFLEPRLVSNKNQTTLLTMIHVHTGLGPSGDDTLLLGAPSSSSSSHENGRPTPQELATTFPGSHIPHNLVQAADDVVAGYDLVLGTAEDLFAPFRNSNSDWILTQEFGTVSSVLVAISLILENMAFHYLPRKDAKEWAIQWTKRAFYKRTPTWRRQVLIRGLRVLNQAIARHD